MRIHGSRGGSSALTLLMGIALMAVLVTFVRSRSSGTGDGDLEGPDSVVRVDGCPEGGEDCIRQGFTRAMESEETYLEAGETCVDVGYLCAGVAGNGSMRLMRWPEGTGRLTIRVPLPRGEDRGRARQLQQAAVRGIMAWHGRPFDFVIDDRTTSSGTADIRVRWSSYLGGNQLGVTEVDWLRQGEDIRFRVLGLTLSTRSPGDPSRLLEPRQVMLTAAHEMGHALGLPHSDARRDVMYPQNTATSLSARDYSTLQALYALPNGAVIRE